MTSYGILESNEQPVFISAICRPFGTPGTTNKSVNLPQFSILGFSIKVSGVFPFLCTHILQKYSTIVSFSLSHSSVVFNFKVAARASWCFPFSAEGLEEFSGSFHFHALLKKKQGPSDNSCCKSPCLCFFPNEVTENSRLWVQHSHHRVRHFTYNHWQQCPSCFLNDPIWGCC